MAGLQEQPRWENEVYRIEENDPVHGGENGITNKPIKQLANRTKYLKQELEKPATTEQVGRVQLDSSTNSTSETTAATPKAVKTVKDLADSNARSLQNVIPNSKKSNSVASTSSDTVATSYAVKQAYDKGVSAEHTANSANNNANGRVSKSGDTMTGVLGINCDNAHIVGQRRGQGSWFVGLSNNTSTDIAFHAYQHETNVKLKSDRLEANKRIYVGNNPVPHSGDSFFELTTEQYGGMTIVRPNRRDKMIVESNGNKFVFVRRNATNGQNHYVISMPEKGGTVLLDNDVTYQKSGNFEIRKYPDGTMIQTFVYEKNDIYPERDGEQTFAWAAAFVERPMMMGQITSSYNGSHDTGINILSKSTNSRVYFHFYEHGNPNQGLCRVQFLGIGRWK